MYDYILHNDALYLIALVIILAVIGALFEFLIVNFASFVKYFVQLVTKIKVVDPEGNKGNFDLYTRWIKRTRKNVFKIGD